MLSSVCSPGREQKRERERGNCATSVVPLLHVASVAAVLHKTFATLLAAVLYTDRSN